MAIRWISKGKPSNPRGYAIDLLTKQGLAE